MEPEVIYYPQDHPWLEMEEDDSVEESSLSEDIRYSLDEIRVG